MFIKSSAMRFFILSTLFLYSMGAMADLNLANGSASGQWWNPARDGEGFYVEIIDTGGNLQVAVAMYSYDDAGSQLWLVGNIAIEDGDTGATVPVFLIEGPVWGTAYDPADKNTTEFGSILVRFPTCDSALFSVQSNVAGLESGNYSLVRATDLVGIDCTEPPPPAPPPPDGGITPGLWTGLGVCFFVNSDGTSIIESELCDEGKSFAADVPGIQVNLNGVIDADKCDANVACVDAWPIETVEQQGVEVQQVICLNEAGGIGEITFDPQEGTANIGVYEAQDLDGRMCFSESVAEPSQ